MSSLYQNNVNIVRYQEGDSSLEKNFVSIPNSKQDAVHTVQEGDDLLYIADRYYGNERAWWIIAFANDIIYPFELTMGDVLNIPFEYAK